eukprot:TRINITY_DN69826_c0_g1_i1.p1 TRINITY_DN69826_c0_g1~~TRINITY_DN69826_c0_g1_i1.p1  ORF type:complete len:482 (-),score=75.22 TRINITY_DN69826_c0_g1_i1:42-1487(-)
MTKMMLRVLAFALYLIRCCSSPFSRQPLDEALALEDECEETECALTVLQLRGLRAKPLPNAGGVPDQFKFHMAHEMQQQDNDLKSAPQFEYSMMFDAGSSGTRLFMYHEGNMSEVMPSEADESRFVMGPLSDYFHEPCSAGPALLKLLNAAEDYIPADAWHTTPVWLRATAGFRLLPVTQAVAVFDCINEYLRKPGLTKFSWKNAQMASGDMEAVYGYISINALESEHVGILELGGASMQIAFKPATPVKDHEFNYYNAAGKLQSIYAKSYMKYGQDQALVRANLQLCNGKWNPEVELEQPCFLRGDHRNFTFTQNPLTAEPLSAPATVRFVGTGDPASCEVLVRSLMHLDYECMMPPCAIAGTHQPAPVGNFVAYSAFFYTMAGLGILDFASPPTVIEPRRIKEAAFVYCSREADEVRKEHLHDWKYAENTCFSAWYVYTMLRALGFKEDDTTITFANRLNGSDSTWTRGALLYLTRYMS